MKKSKVRQLAVILLTVIVLSSAACARKAAGPVPGEMEAEENRGAWASFPMGVFYDGILYFYPESSPGGNEIVMDVDKKIVMAADLDTLETFPLCGKPECTHGRSGGCNAVLDGSVQEVFTVYNGRLYWVAMIKQRHFLYSAELDGSNHREVTELDHELEMHMGGGLICIRNDRLYRLGTGSCIVNGAVVDTVTLYEQPLEKNSRPNVILRLEQPSNVMMKLAGGTLYAAVYDVGEEGLKAHHVTLIAYDTEAGAFDVLFDGSAPCGADDMLVAQDGKSILFSSGPELFSFSLEDKSFSVLLDTGDAGFASDGMRFIITSKTGFRCADHEDNTVFEGELQAEGSDPEGSYLKRYIGFYKGCFYLSLDSWKDDGWRILRIDPQNKKVELVCSGRGNSVTSGS